MSKSNTQIEIGGERYTCFFNWQSAEQVVPLVPLNAPAVVVPITMINGRMGVVPFDPANAEHDGLPRWLVRTTVEEAVTPTTLNLGYPPAYQMLNIVGPPVAAEEHLSPLYVQSDGTIGPQAPESAKERRRLRVGHRATQAPGFGANDGTGFWIIDLRCMG